MFLVAETMIYKEDIQNLINKYKENKDLTEKQLNATITELENDNLDISRKEWLQEDWHSLTGQISVYDCILRDLEKLKTRGEWLNGSN